MTVAETERLALRRLARGDEGFILALLNSPGFIRNIGDRGVRTLDDAWGYIARSAIASYDSNGFGLYRTALKDSGAPIGICGLVKRDGLDAPDLGFAFLEPYWRRGYAVEASRAVLRHARDDLGLTRLLAITAPRNAGSIAVLEKLGFRFVNTIRLPAHDDDSRLFEIAL
ncbi:MAG: GNAT family N-acetyltransferase [Rhizomicrobium sp.]